MAWTDLSSTVPDDSLYTNLGGSLVSSTGVLVGYSSSPAVLVGTSVTEEHVMLSDTYNIPGYDDGFQPSGTPDSITNNFNESGGGGSTRPASGFLYPRGQG